MVSNYNSDTSSERPVQTVKHAGLEFNQGCLSLPSSCWGSIFTNPDIFPDKVPNKSWWNYKVGPPSYKLVYKPQ